MSENPHDMISRRPELAASVRIVGIGASAGGLEALELFFDAMPIDSGLAFVIVQHLSPDFRSMMDELLARHSRMRIRHAADGMTIEANTLYLNPPRLNLIIRRGMLFLAQPDPRDQPNHPIDAFFASLADDRDAKAVGIILSGTGSDGTKGAKSIIEAGGHVLVQEPQSAKFDSMPRSAITQGAFSAKASPIGLPILLQRILAGEPLDGAVPDGADGGALGLHLEVDILRQLETRFGTNFGYYKPSMVARRINRRASLSGLQDLFNYAAQLRENPDELDRLYADLLIGVTAFFRDRASFDALEQHCLSAMCRKMTLERQLRIWVPACASGEEAYSIAILLSEYALAHHLPLNLKIFATDLHPGSLETAASGVYSAQSLAELPDEVRERHFDTVGEKLQVKMSLRSLVVFSAHNLIKDPPFTRMDMISCRNLLIYFDDVAQIKVLSLFHFALGKDGILFLGPSETLGAVAEEFEVIDGRWRIFRKLRDIALPGATRLLPALRPVPKDQPTHPKARALSLLSRSSRNDRRFLNKAYDLLLQRHAPPCVLLSEAGEVLHVFGDAHSYLSWRSGIFSGRLVDLITPSLKAATVAALQRAWADPSVPVSGKVEYRTEDGRDSEIEIRVEILLEEGLPQGYALVTLSEQTAATSRGKRAARQISLVAEPAPAMLGRVEELERSLTSSEEDLQTTNEELETSNEELQSTNDVLMSANEELQSTNEELYAVNEELYSVSSEHRRKIEELTALTNDMDHLLRSTDVGTIFLDNSLNIRRFTPAVARAFHLMDRDVGRPIQHITARFSYPELLTDIGSVMETGQPIEHTVDVDASHLLLRILPYKTTQGILGAVLTLIDVPRLKQAEHALEMRNQELARLNGSLEQFTYIVAHDLRAPLRAILNSAKWIEEDLGDAASDEVRGHCHRLMTYANRLTNMLTDLLAYAKLGSEESAIDDIDLSKLVNEIANTLGGDQRISFSLQGTPSKFRGRRVPLQMVFQNLLDNALKYSDLSAVALTIRIEDTADKWTFTVADDGPGIPKRYQDKVFLPFRKLETGDQKPGTGMGLALVKKAVEDNKGTIELISNPPALRGAAFVFTWEKLKS